MTKSILNDQLDLEVLRYGIDNYSDTLPTDTVEILPEKIKSVQNQELTKSLTLTRARSLEDNFTFNDLIIKIEGLYQICLRKCSVQIPLFVVTTLVVPDYIAFTFELWTFWWSDFGLSKDYRDFSWYKEL